MLINELFEICVQVLEHEVEQRFPLLINVLDTEQPGKNSIGNESQILTSDLHAGNSDKLDLGLRLLLASTRAEKDGANTHLTTYMLCDSICSKETSRSAVEGTPSSSISSRVFFSATRRPVSLCLAL